MFEWLRTSNPEDDEREARRALGVPPAGRATPRPSPAPAVHRSPLRVEDEDFSGAAMAGLWCLIGVIRSVTVVVVAATLAVRSPVAWAVCAFMVAVGLSAEFLFRFVSARQRRPPVTPEEMRRLDQSLRDADPQP